MVRVRKRKPEAERWNAEMERKFCCFPWSQKGQVTEDVEPRRQYITVSEIEIHGGTPGCSACTGNGKTHNKQCHERFQKI